MASYLLEANDLIQTNLWMRQNGQTLINTFHWLFDPVGGSLDGPLALQALNAELSVNTNWYYQKVYPRVTTDLMFDRLTSQKIKPSRWRAETFVLNTAGSRTEDPLPQNVAVSLERWPLTARRGSAGRVQVPGIVIDDTLNGQLTGTALIQWNIVAAALKYTVSLAGGTFTPVLAHLTPTGFSINEVVGAAAQLTTRTMRRRTVGRGI